MIPLLTLLGCGLVPETELQVESAPACISATRAVLLPELSPRDVRRIDGSDVGVSVSGREVSLQLGPSVGGPQVVQLEYSAGRLPLTQTARLTVERTTAPIVLSPEGPWWGVELVGANLSRKSRSKADRLKIGLEGELELEVELCFGRLRCPKLGLRESLFKPADQEQEVTVRLMEQDALFRQRLTPKSHHTLQPGLNTLELGAGDSVLLQVERYDPVPRTPRRLALGELAHGEARVDGGTHPDIWRIDLESPETLLLGLWRPDTDGPSADLYRCDQQAQGPATSGGGASFDLARYELPAGSWLVRVGARALSGPGGEYELLLTTDRDALGEWVAGHDGSAELLGDALNPPAQ